MIVGWPPTATAGDQLGHEALPELDVSGILSDPANRIPHERHLNEQGARKVAEAVARWIGR